MKISRPSLIAAVCLLLTGLTLVALAFLAEPLGLSKGSEWGRTRLLAVYAGGALVLAALLVTMGGVIRQGLVRLADPLRHLGERFLALVAKMLGRNPFFLWLGSHLKRGWEWLRCRPPLSFLLGSREGAACFYAVIIVAAAFLGYAWYATAGRLTTWTPVSNYFDMQADAFLHGQTALLVQPDPALMALPNPYDWRQRLGTHALWDVSLYNGKYYLYWGPTPALLAAGVKAVAPIAVDDSYLVMFFLAGSLGAGALFTLAVRRRFFGTLPGWIVIPSLLALAYANPALYILNRAAVYEAAIIGGQFFLLAGLWCGVMGLTSSRGAGGWLFATGTCWGLAVAARLNLAPAVILLALLAAWQIIRQGKERRRWLLLAGLMLPLALGAAGLMAYNATRFGSPLETGHRYQLTGDALPANYSDVSSVLYAPPNLYSYFFRPLQVDPTFPYLEAPWIKGGTWPAFIPIPALYYPTEPVSGVLLSVPFVWLIVLGLAYLRPVQKSAGELTPGWLAAALAGSAALEAGALLVFISASMRYELDFIPTSILLAAVCFMGSIQNLTNKALLRRSLVVLSFALAITTVLIGLLLGFTGYNNQFEASNPQLFYSLMSFFRR